MKKTTFKHSNNLTKRLAQYGALSVAIAGVADANGQIIYTDIADVTVDPVNTRLVLDLDNDATGDYLFGVNSAGNFAFIFPAASSMASSYNSNAFVGFVSSSYGYPSNLASGAAISSSNPTFSGQRGDFNYSSCGYPGSQFCDGNDGFVGLHFQIGANTHYGWARIQVAPNAGSIILKDYAYNTTPNEAIDAGQTTLSINDFAINKVEIVSLNNSIGLYNLPQNTDYKVYDISGKSVLNGSINDHSYVIEANSITSGIYIVELTDTNTKAVIRKKIVL